MKLSDLEYNTPLEAKLAELETLFDSKTEAGVSFYVSSVDAEIVFQANEKSITRISAAITQLGVLSEIGLNVTEYSWTARDNITYTLTITELKQLGIKMGEHFTECHRIKCAVRDFLHNSVHPDIVDLEGEWEMQS